MSAKKQSTAPAQKAPAPKAANAPAAPAAPVAKAKNVNVHHLTRVEGHGNIVVAIDKDGTVQTCRWEVPEAPRFFEAMLLGRSYTEVHQITSRICGICSIGHQLASLQATEDALGIRPSEQTVILRKLSLHGENLQSHLLHLGYLVLPDLLGVDSVIPLAKTHKKELTGLIALRRLSNEFCQTVCGRTTHPQRLIPGGMAKTPTVAELRELRQKLADSVDGLKGAAALFGAVKDKLPAFQRKTEYVGLVAHGEYALYWGQIGSTMDRRKPARFYRDITREYMVPQSTAKWSRNMMESYMVGALARFNLNHEHLSPLAAQVARDLGLVAPCHNPYYNNLAQLVECVHSTEDSIALIDALLTRGLRREFPAKITPRAGQGTGAVEVPRGILFHNYEYDDEGRIVQADCVIPTNQNHGNIQHDLDEMVPGLAALSEAEIELRTSMLVRAYDPCISCSTHCIDARGLEDDNPRGVIFVRA
ncbi:MAG: Ni/Fe hydrogenase subunit alpha [Desulfovibrionaceae bacterium]|jgi:coenzyme F420-reducing hydrogenase alpha subunit|nr:Ni/Fe hydrogenase subunit alpha [Desulfovibrionaceae bacterium]